MKIKYIKSLSVSILKIKKSSMNFSLTGYYILLGTPIYFIIRVRVSGDYVLQCIYYILYIA